MDLTTLLGTSGLSPLITGGASLLGSIFGANTTAANTQYNAMNQQMMLGEQEQYARENAQTAEFYNQTNLGLAENYNTQMSNTAYQRAVNDMKSAGLNPAMMFSHGGPESAPTVGAPGGPQPSTPSVSPIPSTKTSPLAGLGASVAQAMSTAVQQKEMDLLTSKTAEVNLQNRFTRRTLGIPEVEGGTKLEGLPEVQIQSGQMDVVLKRQQELLNHFNADQMRVWDSLGPTEKYAVIIGKASISAAGELVGLGVKAGIGAALSKWSAKGDAPVAINQMDAVAAARNAIVSQGGRPKASDVLDLANIMRGKVDSGRSGLIQY